MAKDPPHQNERRTTTTSSDAKASQLHHPKANPKSTEDGIGIATVSPSSSSSSSSTSSSSSSEEGAFFAEDIITTTTTTARRVLTLTEFRDLAATADQEDQQQQQQQKLCLLRIHNKVYDCTTWQHVHPGGWLTIRALHGKDATDSFQANHPAWAAQYLPKLYYADLIIEDEEDHDDEDTTSTTGTTSTTVDWKQATVDFHKLTADMQAAGLFETDYGYYHQLGLAYTLLLAVIVAGVLFTDHLGVHVVVGGLLGIFWQQLAFVGHDIGHNAVTHDRFYDSLWGLLVGNLLTGISMAWWKRTHNIHHVVTNSAHHDPTIQHLPYVAVDPKMVQEPIFSSYRQEYLPWTWVAQCLVRIQHYLYYPLMGIARINLYAQSFQHALLLKYFKHTKDLVWHREWQILTLIGFWVWFIALVRQLPNWKSQVAFVVTSHVVSGILNVQTTVSHFAMPVHLGVTYDRPSNGYLQTQLQGTMDIDCPSWFDWFHGGIQFQVAHHLWPRLPRHVLRKVTHEIMIPFLEQHNLPYHHLDFYHANVLVVQKLKETAYASKEFSPFFRDAMNLNG